MNRPHHRQRKADIAALFAVVLCAASYAIAGARGELPRGHPWLQLAMLAIGGTLWSLARLDSAGKRGRAIAVTMPAIAIGSTLVWLLGH